MDSQENVTPERLRAKQRDNQDYFSSKISELTRNIGFGLVAVSFTLLSTDSAFSQSAQQTGFDQLVASSLLGILTVFVDYLQMLFGWWAASTAANNETQGYSISKAGNIFRSLQQKSFYVKQVFAIIGSLFLLSAIIGVIVST